MRYYKLEAVQAALRAFGADGRTIVQERCAELWQRVVEGRTYRVSLAWEDSDQKLSEDEVRNICEALFVQPIIDKAAEGGLWLQANVIRCRTDS
ncbi:MAG: hypothetical protein ACYSUM_19315 [Planctomycetota bacterium]